MHTTGLFAPRQPFFPISDMGTRSSTVKKIDKIPVFDDLVRMRSITSILKLAKFFFCQHQNSWNIFSSFKSPQTSLSSIKLSEKQADSHPMLWRNFHTRNQFSNLFSSLFFNLGRRKHSFIIRKRIFSFSEKNRNRFTSLRVLNKTNRPRFSRSPFKSRPATSLRHPIISITVKPAFKFNTFQKSNGAF